MAERVWAEAAISSAVALVCSVEAETCWAEAEDCSATETTSATSLSTRAVSTVISPTAAVICRHARGHVLDRAADRLEGLAGALDGGDAVLGALRAVVDDADHARRLGLHLADQRGDLAGGALGLLGELADLVGDDREAAALLAGAGGLDGGVQASRLVWSAMPVIVVDDPADALGALGQLRDRLAHRRGGGRDLAHRLAGGVGGVDALERDGAGVAGGLHGRRGHLGAGLGRARGAL